MYYMHYATPNLTICDNSKASIYINKSHLVDEHVFPLTVYGSCYNIIHAQQSFVYNPRDFRITINTCESYPF